MSSHGAVEPVSSHSPAQAVNYRIDPSQTFPAFKPQTPVELGQQMRVTGDLTPATLRGTPVKPDGTVSNAVTTSSETVPGLHGRTRTIRTITINANFVDGGGPPYPGTTIAQEAELTRRLIEQDFSGSFTDERGNEIVYNTRVNMTTDRPTDPNRLQIVYVPNGDSRLLSEDPFGEPSSGIQGRTATDNTTVYISSKRTDRTVAHEIGHVLGQRHPHGGDCSLRPGYSTIENLMSQDGCTPLDVMDRPGRKNDRELSRGVDAIQMDEIYRRHGGQ